MKASYKLQLEQHQRRLGLSHKELNKYDKKHNQFNLIRYLKSSEPILSGFWGNFTVQNQTAVNHRYMDVYLAYNNTPLTNTQRIDGDTEYTFNVSEENRLPSISSILQFKLTMQNGTQSIDLDGYSGFEIQSFTTNPLDQENTINMLINANNYNDGVCSATIVVSYEPH